MTMPLSLPRAALIARLARLRVPRPAAGAEMIQARANPGSKAQSDRANARAASLAPILTKLRASGVTSAAALADALTARNISTLSGRGSWSAARVRHLVTRIKRLEDAAS